MMMLNSRIQASKKLSMLARSYRILVQLDYHPSSQYAGLHLAMKNNMYAKEGLDVELLKPSKYGGDEPTLVIEKQTQIDNMGDVDTISIGLVEQNVLIPAINNNVKVKAFASMFQKSPLSLLALPGTKLSTLGDLKALEIGMHIDSTELMKTIVFHSKDNASTVRTVERSEKMEMLLSGAVNAIQAYDCTEVIELQGRLGGKTPSTVSLEALAAQSGMILPLGYSQVLFAPASMLRKDAAKIALQKFLKVTVEGWKACDKDAAVAVLAVMESRKSMGYPEEQQGILDENSAEFQRLSLARCLPYVATDSPQSHRIDPKKWQEASTAMSALGLVSYNIPVSLSLDTTVFPSQDNGLPPIPQACEMCDGLSLARKTRSDVAKRSAAFSARVGRNPCLAVISFGVASDEERMISFSTPQDSWWTKHHVCEQAGITYKSIVLPSTATAEDLQSAIFKLNTDSSVDAILMERGLGENMSPSISASINQIGSLIVGEKDVDGENPRSLPGARGGDINNASLGSFMVLKDEAFLSENSPRMLPCAVAGILELLDHYKHSDSIPGANIVVVGRSKKLGLPLSLELMQRNATVTTCHSLTPPKDLKRLCLGADYLFVAAGQPHLVTRDMVKQGAVVINIGTTYIKKNGKEASLLPDVHPDVAAVAKVMSPTPHGVGPLPAAMLCHNTLVLAESRARALDARVKHGRHSVPPAWMVSYCSLTNTPIIVKSIICKDFNSAINLIGDIRDISERLDHHPTLRINSRRICEQIDGCTVDIELNTYTTKTITELDIQLANEIDQLNKN